MKIIVHDYSGHPFQVQLSRELARRGHVVLHLFFEEFLTPRGNLISSADDPASFSVRGISIGEPFQKASFVRRRAQERQYGKLLASEIAAFRPDVVLSSNAPLDAQLLIQRAAARAGAGFVFWVQDLYGEAIRRILGERWPIAGQLIGRFYQRLERSILRRSQAAILITEDFVPFVKRAGMPAASISIIENWAPLDELPIKPANNDWAQANGFVGRANLVYAGTIGYKHNPEVLLKIANETDAHVSVFSEGPVAEGLARQAAHLGINNLSVRPWVPFASLPDMLAAADAVIAFVEADAGVCSVPSKVLSYLAAGRPILAAIPSDNLATRIIRRANAGLVVNSGDAAGLVAAAQRLLASPDLRAEMGRNGRAYAEQMFAIEALGDRFEAVALSARLT